MKFRIAALAALFILLAAFGAGCTKPAETGTPAPVPTTEATVAATATPLSVSTEIPLSLPPPEYKVDFTLQKDRVYGTITLTFEGGPGRLLVSKVWMQVTRSDGIEEEGVMKFKNGSQISIGDTIELEGTHGPDHAQVFITLNGVNYKIMDKTLSGQEFYQ